MTTQAVFIHGLRTPEVDLEKQKEPTHDLVFSSPRVPHALRLVERQDQCLRLTITSGLLQPGADYWSSQDMGWWCSAAKRVLGDIHLLLTRQSHADKTLLFRVSLRGPWRCGPWKSDATWLSRFIHHYYRAPGTILHPFRERIDKHLKDFPDTVHFDVFLLQCWHKGFLRSDQARTYATIERINNEAPETCLSTIEAHMKSIAPVSVQQERDQGPPPNDDTWITRPHANLAQWARLRSGLAREHTALFADYARHLMAELKLELERRFPDGSDFPPQSREAYLDQRRHHMRRCMAAYVDCVIILAQRELGMVRDPHAALLRPSSAVSRIETESSGQEQPAQRQSESRGPAMRLPPGLWRRHQ